MTLIAPGEIMLPSIMLTEEYTDPYYTYPPGTRFHRFSVTDRRSDLSTSGYVVIPWLASPGEAMWIETDPPKIDIYASDDDELEDRLNFFRNIDGMDIGHVYTTVQERRPLTSHFTPLNATVTEHPFHDALTVLFTNPNIVRVHQPVQFVGLTKLLDEYDVSSGVPRTSTELHRYADAVWGFKGVSSVKIFGNKYHPDIFTRELPISLRCLNYYIIELEHTLGEFSACCTFYENRERRAMMAESDIGTYMRRLDAAQKLLWEARVEEFKRNRAIRRIQDWWMEIYLNPRHPVGLRKINRDYDAYLAGSQSESSTL